MGVAHQMVRGTARHIPLPRDVSESADVILRMRPKSNHSNRMMVAIEDHQARIQSVEFHRGTEIICVDLD